MLKSDPMAVSTSSTITDDPECSKGSGWSVGASEGALDRDIEGSLDGILLGIADGYKLNTNMNSTIVLFCVKMSPPVPSAVLLLGESPLC